MSEQSQSPTGDEMSNGVMVIVVVVLFIVVLLIGLFYLYARRLLKASAVHQEPPPSTISGGLDAAVLHSVPITVYRSLDGKQNSLECAVCLSEVADGEEVRLLPKCNHGFHLKCIDMWFQSHSTCPLCRTAVANDLSSARAEGAETVIDIPCT